MKKFLIFILITILLSSCNIKNEVTNINDITTYKSTIEESLVSPDNKFTAVIKENMSNDKLVFLIDNKSNEERKIEFIKGDIYDLKWSDSGRYLTVKEKTNETESTIILDAYDFKYKCSISSDFNYLFNKDETKIIYSKPNELNDTLRNDNQILNTFDLILYDLNEDSNSILLKGDEKSHYEIIEWIDSNNIKVNKCHIGNDFNYSKVETYIYNLENKTFEKLSFDIAINDIFPNKKYKAYYYGFDDNEIILKLENILNDEYKTTLSFKGYLDNKSDSNINKDYFMINYEIYDKIIEKEIFYNFPINGFSISNNRIIIKEPIAEDTTWISDYVYNYNKYSSESTIKNIYQKVDSNLNTIRTYIEVETTVSDYENRKLVEKRIYILGKGLYELSIKLVDGENIENYEYINIYKLYKIEF